MVKGAEQQNVTLCAAKNGSDLLHVVESKVICLVAEGVYFSNF